MADGALAGPGVGGEVAGDQRGAALEKHAGLFRKRFGERLPGHFPGAGRRHQEKAVGGRQAQAAEGAPQRQLRLFLGPGRGALAGGARGGGAARVLRLRAAGAASAARGLRPKPRGGAGLLRGAGEHRRGLAHRGPIRLPQAGEAQRRGSLQPPLSEELPHAALDLPGQGAHGKALGRDFAGPAGRRASAGRTGARGARGGAGRARGRGVCGRAGRARRA